MSIGDSSPQRKGMKTWMFADLAHFGSKTWIHAELAELNSETWVNACVLATISGISLPIGAILGIILSPVRDVVCAAWVAFGAGALLFAVTVELYGHDLRELEHGRVGIYEMLATIFGAFVGALFYLSVNRWLEETMEEGCETIWEGDVDVESDAQSVVGSLAGGAQPEAGAHAAPVPRPASGGHLTVTSALAEERRRWEQATSPHGAGTQGFNMRDDSFAMTYNASFNPSRNVSFCQGMYSRNTSFACSEGSFKSRGRDRAINMLAAKDARALSKKNDGPESVREESVVEIDPELARKGNQVAFGLFLGLLVDGVPEGILMGFLAAEGHLSEVLVISLLVANFPEAFSSASLMVQGGIGYATIVSMWTGLCVMVGVLAGISCYTLQHFFPTYPHGDLPQSLLISVAVIEGITGGAMISCIATVMLPEAFARSGGRANPLITSSGFLCTAGFLTAVTMKAFEHHYHEHHT